jgi:hypothetical protein
MSGKKFALPSIERFAPWIILLLVFKILLLLLFHSFYAGRYNPDDTIGFAFADKDFGDYYYPVMHFIQKGRYEYAFPTPIPYAARMPGFFIPCYFFLLLFSKAVAVQGVVCLQIIFAAVSTYFFARVVADVTKSMRWFVITLALFTFFPPFLNYELTFHPDSCANSAFLLSIYFIYTYFKSEKNKYLFLTGLFLGWTFLLRPYLAPYLCVFCLVLFLFLVYRRISFPVLAKKMLLITSPILLFEAFWIIRNERALHKFIPLIITYEQQGSRMTGIYPNTISYPKEKVRSLINSWGGNNLWYLPGSEMNWFLQASDSDAASYQFKSYAFCSAYNRDSLSALRSVLHTAERTDIPTDEIIRAEDKVIATSERYARAYQKERRARYYFISPLLRVKNLVINNPVQDWPGPSFKKSGKPYQAFKLFCSFLFMLTVAGGATGMAYLLFFFRRLSLFEYTILGFYLGLLGEFAYLINVSNQSYFFTGLFSSFLLFILAFKRFSNRIRK